MDQRNYWLKGVSPIAAASILFGLYAFIVKLIISRISPLQLVFYVSLLIVAGLLIIMRFNLRPAIAAFCKHPWRYLALSFTGVVVGETLLLYALNHLDLGVCIMLEKLEPVFVMILAALFLGEHYSRQKYVTAGLAVIASYFVAVKQPLIISITHSEISGIAAILAAAFSWGISSVIGRSLIQKDIAPTGITLLRYFFGVIMLIPVLYFYDTFSLRVFSDPQVSAAVVILVILVISGFIFYYRGLFHVPAAVAGFVKLLIPVVSLFLGIVVLGERLSVTQTVAIPLMLFFVYLISVPEKK